MGASVGKRSAGAGIILILAALAILVWRLPKGAPAPEAESGASGSAGVVEYGQGVRPDQPPGPPPPPHLTEAQRAALEKIREERGALLMQQQAAQTELQAARMTARRDDPELQALTAEIRQTQGKMITRLQSAPGRAELDQKLKEALARLAAVSRPVEAAAESEGPAPADAPAGVGTQGGSFPEEERTQAEKAVVEARMALNAHLARVRTQDAELLALTEQAKALRARLDATLADRPAVAEARAKIDGMNARMSDLVAEQDRILKSDTGSPSDGNPSN